jgi:APA family basic amino acid/polyamine antiporter
MGFGKAIPAFGTALLGVSFAYLGWDAATYMAEEVERPQRTLPRALALATAVVVGLYLLFNMCLLGLVPLGEMAGAPNVAQQAASRLFGTASTGIVSALILICILGAMDATIMVGPRIYFAMARDGLFFPVLGRLHRQSKVPVAALVAQGVWTGIIVITGTFGGILTYSVFAMLILSAAVAVAVPVLRRTRPEAARPYRTWGYPWVPAVYFLGALGIMLNALIRQPGRALSSLVVFALGIPVYVYWQRQRKKP